jgi:hypothetical protein
VLDQRSGLGDARPVQPGRYYSFDGSNDYVITDPLPSTGATELTLCMWLKFDGSDTWSSFMTLRNESTLELFASVWVGDDGGFDFIVTSNGTVVRTTYTAGTSLEDNQWHHIAVTAIDGMLRHYIDGIEVKVTTRAFDAATEDFDLSLGWAKTSAYGKGGVKDVQAYFEELTAENILYLATSGEQGEQPSKTNLIVDFPCEDAHPTIAFNAAGNGYHGTKNGITTETFHVENSDAPNSRQNDVGYSDGPSGTFIPLKADDTTQDVLGNPAQYTGKVPMNVPLVGAPCLALDGVNDYVSAPHLTGSETVVSSGGTATLTISAGRIDGSGTAWDIVLSDGTVYPCSESAGPTIYDVSDNDNHGTIINGTESSNWGQTQDVYHRSIAHGASIYTHATANDLYAPYGDDGQPLTITPPTGYTLQGHYPAGLGLNVASSGINFAANSDAPSMDGLVLPADYRKGDGSSGDLVVGGSDSKFKIGEQTFTYLQPDSSNYYQPNSTDIYVRP